jgi:hypothetical protein
MIGGYAALEDDRQPSHVQAARGRGRSQMEGASTGRAERDQVFEGVWVLVALALMVVMLWITP